ncbi:hypothetical protein [Methylorubrum extorquens]|uniref:Uncharacterized protein n=1 Tax=Methylorubrum extorquens TaxID=408 RepID=A0AAX3WJF7_METEX|nr:hypothetical protein [Methylorubrum extorquens]WHQ70563.1 hypothetical protein KEC54_02775 [Methylorubrum extorquens]
MLRLASLAFTVLGSSAAWSVEIPRYNIEATCRAAPNLVPDARNTDQNCNRDEMQARTQLGQQWASFDARRRETCVQEASLGGSPSYVALLTCLQM